MLECYVGGDFKDWQDAVKFKKALDALAALHAERAREGRRRICKQPPIFAQRVHLIKITEQV